MSIEIICKQAEQLRLLQRYELKDRAAKRRLFLTQEAVKDLGANSSLQVLGIRGAVKARLDEWVGGEQITNSGGLQPGFLKQLDAPPPEVWEIRITAPSPQARAFGRFMCPDAYVITGVYTRSFLGAFGSQAWIDATQECVNRWQKVFGDIQPFSGETCSSYVTENCDEFRMGRLLSERECKLRTRESKKHRSSRR